MTTEKLLNALKKLVTDTGVTDWTIGTVLSETTGDNLDNARMRTRRWLESPPKSAIQWLALVRVICSLSPMSSREYFIKELSTYLGVDNPPVSLYDEEKKGEANETTTI